MAVLFDKKTILTADKLAVRSRFNELEAKSASGFLAQWGVEVKEKVFAKLLKGIFRDRFRMKKRLSGSLGASQKRNKRKLKALPPA